jgi:hypothetical protein
MTLPFDEDDPVVDVLRALPAADVPAHRAEAIRRRCQAELARTVSRDAGAVPVYRRAWRPVVEPAMVVGLAAMFLVEVLRRAAALY